MLLVFGISVWVGYLAFSSEFFIYVVYFLGAGLPKIRVGVVGIVLFPEMKSLAFDPYFFWGF